MKTLSLAPVRPSTARDHTRRRIHPPKLFYRIQEAAKLTGLKPSVLRYWETEFSELHPEKDASDQRRYRPSDIEVVRAVRKLLYEDRFTIKGARGRLREELRRRRDDNGQARPIVARRPTATAPSLTEFRLRPSAKGEARKQRLGQSLRKLRSDVHALLSMLS
jgi:DNA-binding transcriptional MerR regulator